MFFRWIEKSVWFVHSLNQRTYLILPQYMKSSIPKINKVSSLCSYSAHTAPETGSSGEFIWLFLYFWTFSVFFFAVTTDEPEFEENPWKILLSLLLAQLIRWMNTIFHWMRIRCDPIFCSTAHITNRQLWMATRSRFVYYHGRKFFKAKIHIFLSSLVYPVYADTCRLYWGKLVPQFSPSSHSYIIIQALR